MRNLAFIDGTKNMLGQTIHDSNILLRTHASPANSISPENYAVVFTDESSAMNHRTSVSGTVEKLRQTKKNLRTGKPINRNSLNFARALIPFTSEKIDPNTITSLRNSIFGAETAETRKELAERLKYEAPRVYSPGRVLGPGKLFKSATFIGLFKSNDAGFPYILEYIKTDFSDEWLLLPVSFYSDIVALVQIKTEKYVSNSSREGANTNYFGKNDPKNKKENKAENNNFFASLTFNYVSNGENSDPLPSFSDLFKELIPLVQKIPLTRAEQEWWWKNTKKDDKLSSLYSFSDSAWDQAHNFEMFMRTPRTVGNVMTHSPEDLRIVKSHRPDSDIEYSRVYNKDGVKIFTVKIETTYPLFDSYGRSETARLQQEIQEIEDQLATLPLAGSRKRDQLEAKKQRLEYKMGSL
jgi:hypothetical protein